MYHSYFGLDRLPFDGSPDPHFLFASPAHREAMAAIAFGIDMGKALTLITGEVGLGKTTLLRAYLSKMERGNRDFIYVFHPDIGFDDLLQLIADEICVETKDVTGFQLLKQVQNALVRRYTEQHRRVVVIIDEAQRLPAGTLESLRLLSNLESDTEKLIQIVLVGQTELEEILARPEMRQLNQRITLRCRLKPLSVSEAASYIVHRLQRAGSAEPFSVFTPRAVKVLAYRSGGVPRLLNALADNALLNGFGMDERPVSAKTVIGIANEQASLGLLRSIPRRAPWAWIAGILNMTVTIFRHHSV